MSKHSIVNGIHFYDVGIGGDSLRGPEAGANNDHQVFLAHDNAPEHWNGDVLETGASTTATWRST